MASLVDRLASTVTFIEDIKSQIINLDITGMPTPEEVAKTEAAFRNFVADMRKNILEIRSLQNENTRLKASLDTAETRIYELLGQSLVQEKDLDALKSENEALKQELAKLKASS